MSEQTKRQQATLGGGCFWCLEAAFQILDGVHRVTPGYAGGQRPNPTYEQVCSGATGHAEVVQVEFDPERIDYPTLLSAFFTVHDPTTPNRQGHDVGPQYRSIILYHDDAQRSAAEAVIRELEADNAWGAPIVTELQPLATFYPAEAHHHDYFAKNAGAPYCQFVIRPKLDKIRAAFPERSRT